MVRTRLRIVIVTTMPPLPFGHPPGGRWTYVLLKGLVERGHQVSMFVPSYRTEDADKLNQLFPTPEYDLRTYPVENETASWPTRKWRTLRQPFSFMFGNHLRCDVRAVLSEPWDVLHLEDAWAGWVGLPFDRRRTLLNFHNLYCVDDQAENGAAWRQQMLRRWQHRAEARLARSYPRLLALTPQLATGLRRIAPKATVDVVPLGMDVGLYSFIPAERRPNSQVVSVIGSMNWGPSLTAARRLIERLWPQIRASVPTAKCRIVGWNARKHLASYLDHPGIEILENVADIQPYFEDTSVMLYAPVSGSGMKVKILESFAYGIPVVTTSDGVEGIPAIDGVHAGICDDDAGLIARTVGLLRDRTQQEQQRQKARRLLEQHCGAESTLNEMERQYERVLSETGAS